MHYVALSRATSYSGLYIDDLNEKNIAVSRKVNEYISEARKTSLLDTAITYWQEECLNITFNNCRSFKLHFNSICRNHIILDQDIAIFAESRLNSKDKNKDYAIKHFQTICADEKKSPLNAHYGIIAFIRKSIPVQHAEYLSDEKLDILLIVLQYNEETLSLLTVYNSPQNTLDYFEYRLLAALNVARRYSNKVIIIGDFNIQKDSVKYDIITTKLDQFQLLQHIDQYTTVYKTIIDLVYSNTQIQHKDTFHCHWSDHQIVHIQVN